MTSSSFESLFKAHQVVVLNYLRRRGARDADLDDLCQEVFLVVCRRHHTFEGRSTLRSWILGIARHVLLNHRRRACIRRELPQAEPPEAESPDNPATALRTRQLCDRLQAGLARLAPPQREAFTEYALGNEPMRMVAQRLRCPIPTAFSRVNAARASLRVELRAQDLI